MAQNPMQLIQMMMQSRNPKQMVQNMMQNNPQMRSAMNQVNAIFAQGQKNGMNKEQSARQYAKQNNIDIDSMINNMKQMGAKF